MKKKEMELAKLQDKVDQDKISFLIMAIRFMRGIFWPLACILCLVLAITGRFKLAVIAGVIIVVGAIAFHVAFDS